MDDPTVDKKDEVYFKKLLRLNRLQYLEKLSPEQRDLLEKNHLTENYIENLIPLDNWYIIVTSENKELIEKWVTTNYKKAGPRAYNIGAFYGVVKNELYTRRSRPQDCKELTTDQLYRYKL